MLSFIFPYVFCFTLGICFGVAVVELIASIFGKEN